MGSKEKGEGNTLGLNGKLEGCAVTVEGPGALLDGQSDRGFVSPSK